MPLILNVIHFEHPRLIEQVSCRSEGAGCRSGHPAKASKCLGFATCAGSRLQSVNSLTLQGTMSLLFSSFRHAGWRRLDACIPELQADPAGLIIFFAHESARF